MERDEEKSSNQSKSDEIDEIASARDKDVADEFDSHEARCSQEEKEVVQVENNLEGSKVKFEGHTKSDQTSSTQVITRMVGIEENIERCKGKFEEMEIRNKSPAVTENFEDQASGNQIMEEEATAKNDIGIEHIQSLSLEHDDITHKILEYRSEIGSLKQQIRSLENDMCILQNIIKRSLFKEAAELLRVNVDIEYIAFLTINRQRMMVQVADYEQMRANLSGKLFIAKERKRELKWLKKNKTKYSHK